MVVSDSCCFPFLNTSTFSLQYRLHVTFILSMGWFVPSRLRDNKKHNSLTSEEGRRESWEEGNKINIYFLLPNVPRARTPYSLTAPARAFLLTARLPVTLCAKKGCMQWKRYGKRNVKGIHLLVLSVQILVDIVMLDDTQNLLSSLYPFSFLSRSLFVESPGNFSGL